MENKSKNILLVSGSGKNVGKTTFIQKIISEENYSGEKLEDELMKADLIVFSDKTQFYPDPGYIHFNIRFTGSKTSSNICLVGENLQKGSQVLTKGTLIEPQHIAMLAAVGCFKPMVYKQPTVGIISTGPELIEPNEKPTPSKIRNSNGHQLVAQVSKMGFPVSYLGIVKNDAEATLEAIRKSTSENNVTLISGEVSIGDFDYVPWAIEQAGFKILFNKMAVKPGKSG